MTTPLVTTGSSLPASNSAFLRALAGPLARSDSMVWVCGFDGIPVTTNPGWRTGYAASFDDANELDHANNNYFSVSLFPPGTIRRRKESSPSPFVVCIDDAQNVALAPSYVLRTSAGKVQASFALADVVDEAVYTRLMQHLGSRRLVIGDPSGNNSVRLIRLAFGCNWKSDPPFPHVLELWDAERRYPFAEVCDALGFNPNVRPLRVIGGGRGRGIADFIRAIHFGEDGRVHDGLYRLIYHHLKSGMAPGRVVETLHGHFDACEWQERNPVVWQQRRASVAAEVQRTATNIAGETEAARPQRIITRATGLSPDDKPPRYLTVEAMLEDAVYAPTGSGAVVLRSKPHLAYKLGVFHTLTCSSKIEIQEEGGRPKKVPVSALWIARPDRVTVDSITYAPGSPRFCADPANERLRSINMWSPFDRSDCPDDWEERSEAFVKHVYFIIPETADANRFLDWLAHVEQRPGVLPHSHWLSIAIRQGVGRNWIASVLDRVWPGAVATGHNIDGIIGGNFNGLLSRKLMVVVDEVRVLGASQWKYAEDLKIQMTSAIRVIKEKYGPEFIELNCLRWLMFSNHRDALPIPPGDRRVNVAENEADPKPAAYYTDLYGKLTDKRFIQSVARFLGTRDISAFNPGERAPMSKAKARMIEAGKSEMTLNIESLIAEWTPDPPDNKPYKSDVIAVMHVWDHIEPNLPASHKELHGVHLGRALLGAGAVRYPTRPRVNGVTQTIWILRRADHWLAQDATVVAAAAGSDRVDLPRRPR